MARGPLITREVEALILSVHYEHPKWKAKEIRSVVRGMLREKSQNQPELLPKLTKGWPSLGAVQGILSPLRKGRTKPNPKDQPWSFAALVGDYPIPADAMPTVMSIYKRVLSGERELTIREAQWVARLHRIFDDLDLLWDWALQYALSEWVSEITHNLFDTTDLDLELVRNPQYAIESLRSLQRWGAVWDIAEKYSANLDEAVDLMGLHLTKLDWETLSNEEIEEIAKSLKANKEVKHAKKSHKP